MQVEVGLRKKEEALHSCPVSTNQCSGIYLLQSHTTGRNRKEANKCEKSVSQRWDVGFVAHLRCGPTHIQTGREGFWAQLSRSRKAGRLPEVSLFPKHSVFTTFEKNLATDSKQWKRIVSCQGMPADIISVEKQSIQTWGSGPFPFPVLPHACSVWMALIISVITKTLKCSGSPCCLGCAAPVVSPDGPVWKKKEVLVSNRSEVNPPCSPLSLSASDQVSTMLANGGLRHLERGSF